MNTIRRYGNPGDAMVAQSLLAAAGIEATLADEFAGSLGPQFAPWGMRLQVTDEDAQRALEILGSPAAPDSIPPDATPDPAPPADQDSLPPAPAPAPSITCPNCRAGWVLTGDELAQPSFTCDCGTVIPLRKVEALPISTRAFDWQSFLPRSQSKWVFILVMIAYSRILQSTLAYIVEPFTGRNDYLSRIIGWDKVFIHLADAIVFAPIWETLLLVGIIELLRWIGFPPIRQIIVSTALLCMVDGYYWWPHGVIVGPFFFICGVSYLYWREASWRTAIVIVILIHAISNCVAETWLIFTQLDRDRVSLTATGSAGSWDRADKLFLEGSADLRANATSAAIDELQQAIALYPYDPRYHVWLGAAYQSMGRLTEAESQDRKAISLDENDWMAWEHLGSVLNSEKRFPAALDAEHRALSAAPPYGRSEIEAWIMAIAPNVTGASK